MVLDRLGKEADQAMRFEHLQEEQEEAVFAGLVVDNGRRATAEREIDEDCRAVMMKGSVLEKTDLVSKDVARDCLRKASAAVNILRARQFSPQLQICMC